MRSRESLASARDQAPSGFSPVLQRLCDAVAGLSAALVDQEGETVDYVGQLAPYDIKVAAAEWSLVVRTLSATRVLDRGDTFQLCFRGKDRSFAVIFLLQGYALVVEIPAGSLLLSRRAVVQAVREISIEAGLDVPDHWRSIHEHWTRVSVQTDRSLRRPTAIWCSEEWWPITILGRIRRDQLERSEAGYRVRFADGGETTLIREPLDRWYAEEWADFARKP